MEQANVKKVKILGIITYAIAVLMLFTLTIMHLFNLFSLNVDKFSFFIVSVLVALLIIPIASYVKFFGFIEVRKDPRIMKK